LSTGQQGKQRQKQQKFRASGRTPSVPLRKARDHDVLREWNVDWTLREPKSFDRYAPAD
jgi:hypothetical protein